MQSKPEGLTPSVITVLLLVMLVVGAAMGYVVTATRYEGKLREERAAAEAWRSPRAAAPLPSGHASPRARGPASCRRAQPPYFGAAGPPESSPRWWADRSMPSRFIMLI